ncbi:methyltransferase domain-containing protein [Candidatus Pacearchaeota archaeon]|nr:methyltransferase domain-containing protein [Candidatus Pacearchaeota archaeon]
MAETPKLHPFEYVGAHKLYTEERFLLADEMGMFKTAQAIFANSKFREKKRRLRTLIVTPTSVREHWARELQKWAHPRGDVNIIYSQNLNEGRNRIKDFNWTITSYPLMSRAENGLLVKLRNSGFHHVIADEVHNAKNPDALRTRALKSLIDQADYVSLLSGTPIPNTMSDLYVLMSMLDPQQYPFDPEKDSSDVDNFRIARQSFIQLYVERPQAVKELLHRKMLRRMAKDYLGDHIPEVENHRFEVPLTGRHLEAYQRVIEQETNVGRKIMDLAKVSLDPYLIDDSLPRLREDGSDISDKYSALDDIVEREMSKKDGKVLVFTNLKTGIVDYLTEKYQEYGAIKVTGDISTFGGEREALRQQFQRDPKTRVLIATTTMNEGVDLTAATAVVDLTIPLTPAERGQRHKRSHRPGEIKKDKVDIYTPFTTIPGKQASLDQALLEMIDGKERIVDYLLKGMQISLEELMTYDNAEKVPRIVRAITSPSKAVFNYYLRWRGVGSESARRRMDRSPEMAKYIAELYPGFSMAKNAADIYVPIIKGIEKDLGRSLEGKLDIAGGPGMLGYFLKEPTVAFDINPDMVAEGKKLYPENKLFVGSMNSLPLKDNSSELAVCSLAFQMSEPKKERSQTLQEMSRVLKDSGYAIITIPCHYMNEGDEKKFQETVNSYGLSVKEHNKLVGPSKIDYYLLQKTSQVRSKESPNLTFQGDPRRK